ncbi:MAG: hypothetical protein AABW61_00735 [Candidatus Aenigmatarchaeota archaeon]
MSNGFKISKMTNGNRLISEHNYFLQEQLMDAQQSLFFARSVKEAKFLQSRINYLKVMLKTTGRKIRG